MKKIILICVSIIFLLTLLFAIVFICLKEDKQLNAARQVGDSCWGVEDSENLSPGLQCYFYGDGEERKGIVIKTDINAQDFLLSYYNPSDPHVSDIYLNHKNLIATWDEPEDLPSEYSFKVPEGAFVEKQQDNGYSVALGNIVGVNDMPISFYITTYENNAVKMSERWPEGCLASDITLDTKVFNRFDCLPQSNIQGVGTSILFRQEKDFYYKISFNKTGSAILDYYTEAILVSMKFN